MINMPQNNISQRIVELLREEKTEQAVQLFETLLPNDQSEVLKELDDRSQAALVRALDEDALADVLDVMDDPAAARITRHMDIDQLVSVVDEMEPDEAADLLGDLDAGIAEQALDKMASAETVEPLMIYGDDTAGGLMTSEFISFKGSARTAEVLEGIRAMEEEKRKVPYVFVINEQGGLLGLVDLFQLIASKPDETLETYTKTQVITVNVGDDREKAARLMVKYDLVALPVVDDRGSLKGIITVDDALETLDEETTEDFYNQVALGAFGDREMANSYNLVRGPLWKTLRVRIPFLVITLLGGVLAGLVIGGFEEALQAITGLAFFIPAVMDMGGNAGTQSSTIFTRALVLGHIRPHRFLKHWLRETLVGLTMGVISGLVAGLIAAWWQPGIPNIGLVVGLSLVMTITLATSLGFMIPFLLNKAGVDQAAGADPIITTIKDVTGLLIYFVLVNTFIHVI
jgi:magnesium transporter